jgi:hypothetical protein
MVTGGDMSKRIINQGASDSEEVFEYKKRELWRAIQKLKRLDLEIEAMEKK